MWYSGCGWLVSRDACQSITLLRWTQRACRRRVVTGQMFQVDCVSSTVTDQSDAPCWRNWAAIIISSPPTYPPARRVQLRRDSNQYLISVEISMPAILWCIGRQLIPASSYCPIHTQRCGSVATVEWCDVKTADDRLCWLFNYFDRIVCKRKPTRLEYNYDPSPSALPCLTLVVPHDLLSLSLLTTSFPHS